MPQYLFGWGLHVTLAHPQQKRDAQQKRDEQRGRGVVGAMRRLRKGQGGGVHPEKAHDEVERHDDGREDGEQVDHAVHLFGGAGVVEVVERIELGELQRRRALDAHEVFVQVAVVTVQKICVGAVVQDEALRGFARTLQKLLDAH